MANYLLSLQDSGGAIADGPGWSTSNIDSDMEYALIGLAAAYDKSGNSQYLSALEKGIAWLAARQDMSTTMWRGSWWYTYGSMYPYDHIATSPGSGVTDVRGVDSTCALFVYLLYLHQHLTGSSTLVNQYAANAQAALDFVMTYNMDSDGFTWSSWQLISGSWQLYKYKYAADQGDVYLGLRAGGILYDGTDQRYTLAANRIATNLPGAFFATKAGRYAEGLDEFGGKDWNNEFDAIFPQGYVPWVFGSNSQNLAAYQWLANGVQSNGSLILYSGDPGYSLSASIFGMAASTLGQPAPTSSFNWIVTTALDQKTGGVHDTGSTGDEESNIAGFTIVSLLGVPSF
jgi:hypothetical protein